MGRPAAKRAQIEAAAIRLFATKGIAETTVKDIAALAGVTEGALYRHYSGKNEMAWKLFCCEVETFSLRLRDILMSESAPFQSRLRDGVRFIYEYYSARPTEFSFILLTQHGFPRKSLLDEKRNPNDIVIRFIRTAMAHGHSAPGDPVLVTALLMGAVLQPLVMHRYGRLKKDPRKCIQQVTRACMRLLGQGADRGAISNGRV